MDLAILGDDLTVRIEDYRGVEKLGLAVPLLEDAAAMQIDAMLPGLGSERVGHRPGNELGIGAIPLVTPEKGPDFWQNHQSSAGRRGVVDQPQRGVDIGGFVLTGVHLQYGNVEGIARHFGWLLAGRCIEPVPGS